MTALIAGCSILGIVSCSILAIVSCSILGIVGCSILGIVGCSILGIVSCSILGIVSCSILGIVSCSILGIVSCSILAIVSCSILGIVSCSILGIVSCSILDVANSCSSPTRYFPPTKKKAELAVRPHPADRRIFFLHTGRDTNRYNRLQPLTCRPSGLGPAERRCLYAPRSQIVLARSGGGMRCSQQR